MHQSQVNVAFVIDIIRNVQEAEWIVSIIPYRLLAATLMIGNGILNTSLLSDKLILIGEIFYLFLIHSNFPSIVWTSSSQSIADSATEFGSSLAKKKKHEDIAVQVF